MLQGKWICGAAVAAAGLLGAPAAYAGTYEVVACNGSESGGVNNSWTYELGDLRGLNAGAPAADPANFQNGGSCDAGIYARSWAGEPQKKTGYGTSANLSFSATAGTSIVGVEITRYGEARPSADDPNTEDNEGAVWQVYAQNGADGSQIGGGFSKDACKPQPGGDACTTGAPGGATESYRLAAVPKVTWGVACGGETLANCFTNAGPDFGFYPLATFAFYGARVRVEDNARPTDVAVGGPFTAEGWHRRSDQLTVSGKDASGVRSVAVAVDGVPFKEVAAGCDFTRRRPCGNLDGAAVGLGDGAFPIADGDHLGVITVTDPAGNATSVEQRLRIDENGPQVSVRRPEGQTIVADASDAASGLASAQIETRPLPGGQYGPVETRIENGQIIGRAAGDATRLGIRITARDAAGNATVVEGVPTALQVTSARAGGGPRRIRRGRVRVRASQPVAIRGILRGADGQPLGGRPVAVTAALRRESAPPLPVATVTTAADGTFDATIPPGPSRLVRLAFEGGPGALPNSRGLSLRVRASSTIRASRKRLGGPGRVRFSGRLRTAGQPLPRGGKLVELQAFDRGKWRTFATTRARGSKARWKRSYRFSGRRGRYPIRARIRRESAFPFELGYSRRVVVRVR